MLGRGPEESAAQRLDLRLGGVALEKVSQHRTDHVDADRGEDDDREVIAKASVGRGLRSEDGPQL